MQVVVVGGAGVLGQALLRAVVARGVLTRSDGSLAPVRRVIAVDRTQLPRLFVDPCVEYVRADLSSPRLLSTVMGTVTDSVFHAWDGGDRVEGGREAPSFVLIDSLRDLFAACALQSTRPKVVLASSYAAAVGPGFPGSREGLTALVGELLLTDAVRRCGLDGRALRLALIADAPGCASFVGELLRAMRDGRPACCPIARDAPLWLTSAPAAALALVHAHELPALAWAEAGQLNAPARTLNVDALLEALGRLTGASVDALAVQADAALCEALAQRPPRVPIETSLALGFEDGPDADALVRELVPRVVEAPGDL
jgi:nucleoside-diphosphate-sugar epimerase